MSVHQLYEPLRAYGIPVPWQHGVFFSKTDIERTDVAEWCEENSLRYGVQDVMAWAVPYTGVSFENPDDLVFFRLSFPDVEMGLL